MDSRNVTVLLRIGKKTYRADAHGVRLDLASLATRVRAAAQAKRGKLRKVPPPAFPRAAEISYARDLLAMCAAAKASLDKHLPAALGHIFATAGSFLTADAAKARRDEYATIISDVFGDIELEYEKRVKKARAQAARSAADRTQKANAREHTRYFKAVIGIDVTQSEPWLKDFVDLFVESNVGLIKSISTTYFGQVRDIVESAAITGRRPESLAADIEERFGVSESKARLIARDQTGKLNGQLTSARQQRLGIRSFVWRTSGDERVRESHEAKEGLTYEWQDPPADTGMPGEDYQCRCTAEPNLEDVAEEV